MKIKIVFLFTIFLIANNTYSQTPSWQWAHSGGSNNEDGIPGIAIDGSENSYVIGFFRGPSFQIGNITLSKNDSTAYDIFIAKHNPAGNLVWAKRFGGTGDDMGVGITWSPDGYIYITGRFSSDTLLFDSFSLINNSGNYNMFIAKLDTSGNVIWCKNPPEGDYFNISSDIAAAPSGNVFITGIFKSPTITFESFVLHNSDTTGLTRDLFITGYDSSGQVLFAKSSGGGWDDAAYDITVDGNNYIYVTGSFKSPAISFDNITLLNTTALIHFSDYFLAKFDASGNVVWAKNEWGTEDDEGRGITTDLNNNVYIVGNFSGDTIIIDTTLLINTSMWSMKDIFIAKYSSAGNLVWAKSGNGLHGEYAYAIAVDQNFNSYITGFYTGTYASFDTIVITNGTAMYDFYLVKYDASGNALWAKDLTIPDQAQAVCVETSVNGNIYITGGFFTPTVTFDTITLFNTTPNWFMTDNFIAKIGNAMTMTPEEFPPTALRIFPNPTSGMFMVSFGKTISHGSIEISDVMGNNLLRKTFDAVNEKQISLADVASGIYFMKIRCDEKEYFYPLVITHF